MYYLITVSFRGTRKEYRNDADKVRIHKTPYGWYVGSLFAKHNILTNAI